MDAQQTVARLGGADSTLEIRPRQGVVGHRSDTTASTSEGLRG